MIWLVSLIAIFVLLYFAVGALLVGVMVWADRKWPKLRHIALLMFCWPMAFLDNKSSW